MKRLELPKGWAGVRGNPRWRKPYGWCFRAKRTIEVYPPKWIPGFLGIREWFTNHLIWNHEALHAWGSPGCFNPWCLGYEGKKWKEYSAMPLQLLNGLRFCDVCKSFYRGDE